MQKIRAIIIPRINYREAYIHVGKHYEGRMVKVIRDESVNPSDRYYSVYGTDNELICTVSCSCVVYYYSSKEVEVIK